MMKRTLLFILFISVSCLCFSQENAGQLIKKAENKIAEYDYKQALSLCDKALQLDPKSSHAMLTVALIRHDLHQYKESIDECDKAMKVSNNYSIGWEWRGISNMALGNYTEAIADMDKCEKFMEDKARGVLLYMFRGNAKAMSGDYKGALADYDTEIRLDKDYYNATYYNRGIIRYKLGDHKGALDDIGQTVARRPQLKEGFCAMGVIYRDMKKYAEAIANLNKALLIDSMYAEAYYHRGLMKSGMGNHAGAMRDFDKALKYSQRMIEPNPERYWYKMHCEKLLLLQPNEKDIYYHRMLSKLKTDDKKGACEDAKKAKSLGYPVTGEELKACEK